MNTTLGRGRPPPVAPLKTARLRKYLVPLAGLVLAAAFVVVFFAGREDAQPLHAVAPRVGMSYDELMAMGPRIASGTGATLGTSRRVVYLLACSGLPDKASFEAQATDASRRALSERLTDREAVLAVLARNRPPTAGSDALKHC